MHIKVNPKLEIPTAFSPNGDGINDVWRIPGLDAYRPLLVTVYNRLGTKIYQSNGYPQPWDGQYLNQALPAGTYYYIFDFKNARPTLSGWVAIVK